MFNVIYKVQNYAFYSTTAFEILETLLKCGGLFCTCAYEITLSVMSLRLMKNEKSLSACSGTVFFFL